jgi:GSH-dependent disulfide-bond oxidoreductase
MLSWLMFIATGVGPYSGQAVHFKHFAPKDQNHDYAHNRYQFETDRHYKILDGHLKGRSYMVGDSYSIVDMALWGWARMVPFKLGDDAFARYPNVKRLVDEVTARPAAARAIALKDKFTFKAEMDDEARGNMFKHMTTKVA